MIHRIVVDDVSVPPRNRSPAFLSRLASEEITCKSSKEHGVILKIVFFIALVFGQPRPLRICVL